MSQAQAAAGVERLPWLKDEPSPTPARPRKRASARELAGWAVAAILLVGGASYWMGAHSWEHVQAPRTEASHPTGTAPLPQPRAAEPQPSEPQVVFEPAPQVSPAPAREVPLERPRSERRSVARSAPTSVQEAEAPAGTEQGSTTSAAQKAAPAAAKAAVNPDSKPLTVWPAWKSAGAKGRIVRIGAFGTRDQAKLGWRYMVQAYPAVAHLKATVVGDRNSRGRRFYRFQIGTTSQAHSEVLCQRMEKIHLSCAVVGLPWDPKGVER